MKTETFLLVNAAAVLVLGFGTFIRADGASRTAWSRIWGGFAAGLVIGASCYLIPAGLDSIEGRESFQARYFTAAGLAVLAAIWIARSKEPPFVIQPLHWPACLASRLHRSWWSVCLHAGDRKVVSARRLFLAHPATPSRGGLREETLSQR